MLDALGLARVPVVIDNDNGAILDAHILDAHTAVALRHTAGFGFGVANLLRRLALLPPTQRTCIAPGAYREHRPYQHHALSIYMLAQKLREIDIDGDLRHREIGGTGLGTRVGDLGVGDHDARPRREQHHGGTIHRQVATGLLLDARRNARLHPVGRDEEIDGNEQNKKDTEDHPANLHGTAPWPAP